MRRILTFPRLALAAAALLLSIGSARADLVISAQTVTAAAGSTGNFLEVDLTNTGPSSVSIGAFSFGLSVASTDITLQSADISTSVNPYIFVGHSLFGPIINTSSGQSLVASDEFNPIGSGVTVGSGASVGLGRVSFDVSDFPAKSFFDVFVDIDTTSLTGPTGGPVNITTLTNGGVKISSTVPEPSSLALLAIGGLGLIGARRAFGPSTKRA
jgi:hypothetical protein